MNAMLEIIRQGGIVMIPMGILSVVLYERCVALLLSLAGTGRAVRDGSAPERRDLESVRRMRERVENRFDEFSFVIGALIAAAPLLGLLGTVIGMVDTFEFIASRGVQPGAGGLAGGISMALVTTEMGLAVAIPAVILVNFAQRMLRRVVLTLTQVEGELLKADARA